jgi:hypothetical protein
VTDVPPTTRAIVGCLTALAALMALCTPSAHAARTATSAERTALLRGAAASSDGDLIGLRVGRGGRATAAFAPGLRTRTDVLAVRGLIDPSWALLVVAQEGRGDWRRTFVLERVRARWRVRMSASRGSEYVELCRHARPGTAIALDLGLTSLGGQSRCRHKRSRTSLVRPMDPADLASVRAMVEWHFDPEYGGYAPGPVQPEVSEVHTSSCDWDGNDGRYATPPSGEVARADARWGAVAVDCVTGTDGFAELVNRTLLLVGRSGASGAFTRVAAHTMMSWSVQGNLCAMRARSPVPAAPRAALDFCTPFPYAVRSALR